MEGTICNGANRIKFVFVFSCVLALTVYELLTLKFLDLENFFKVKVIEEQPWQWGHLMANIKIYKSRISHFCAISHHFLDVDSSYFNALTVVSRLIVGLIDGSRYINSTVRGLDFVKCHTYFAVVGKCDRK